MQGFQKIIGGFISEYQTSDNYEESITINYILLVKKGSMSNVERPVRCEEVEGSSA